MRAQAGKGAAARIGCRRLAWLAAGVVVLTGCSRGGLELAPVEGVVTYNGEPLADAGVLFTPERGPVAMGVTDEQGRFSLTTANRSGAVMGEHRVAISKAETTVRHVRGNPMPVYDTRPLIPPKYFDGSTSELSATVDNKRNYYEFNLTAR